MVSIRPSVAPKSGITSWGGWPDDVRETVRKWNGQRKLSFLHVRAPLVYFGAPVFLCGACGRLTRLRLPVCVWSAGGVSWHGGRGDTVMRGALVCDPCIVAKARAE